MTKAITIAAIATIVILLFIISAKFTIRFFLSLIGLLLLLWLLIQTSPVQNFIVGKITSRLSNELHTEVSIKNISFSFFDKLDLNGTLIRDLQKDTLLYAGAMKVRITDWFFLKDKAELSYIGLEDAVIKQQRKDSTWNLQFLIDYFSAPPSTDTTKGIELDFKKVDLKNVTYIKNDEWKGEKMIIKAGSLLLDAEKIDVVNNRFIINTIELDKPYFSIENFDGNRPLNPNKNNLKDTGLYFNEGGIYAKINLLTIKNGQFRSLIRGKVSESGLFNGADIQVSKLNGNLEKLSFNKDTIMAGIELTAIERCGIELKKFKADFKLTPQIMEFAKLDLRTNKSKLADYYAMQYKDFNKDMGDYVYKVVMNAHIKNTEINSGDIAYFAPALSTWKKQFELNGSLTGTVNNFAVKDLFLRAGINTFAGGNLIMKGLPDIEKTFITLSTANVQTSSLDIAFLYPNIKTITDPNLAALGNIRFLGNFNGTLRSFTAKGTVSSNLGGMYTNLTMSFPAKSEPVYKGELQTEQFNLGKFLNIPSIGKVSFKGIIDGSSFLLGKVKTTVDGDFKCFEFNHYGYSNLHFDGAIEKKKFNGYFKTDDPNFEFTSNIVVDLSGEKPVFNVLGDLAKANFKKLNFTNNNFQLTGLFDLNFTGRNIDEFLGSAKILNASLQNDSTQLSFDSLSLNSFFEGDKKILSIKSNEFDALVSGRFNILDLPNSFQLFLSKYYPAYINPPKKLPVNQDFIISFTTRNVERFTPLLHPKLSGFNDMELIGGINTKDTGFYVKATIPFAQFAQFKMSNLELDGKGNLDNLQLTGALGNFYLSDSSYFPDTKLEIQSTNDHSVVHISTSSNNGLNDANLNADIYTLQDGVRINFRPSSFILNDKKWDLEKAGELLIKKNFASAENVKFSQGFQEISIETENEDASNISSLVVKLKDLNMSDFMPLFLKNPKLEGNVNGKIYLRDFYGNFKAEADLIANQFRLDDDSVGVINIKAGFDKITGKIPFEIISANEKYNFSTKGFYNIKDSIGSPLYTTFHLKGTKINLLNQFLNGVFSDISGYATGDLVMKGQINTPDLLGKISLIDAGLTVKYTQVRYNIDSAVFNFKEGSIDFGEFKLTDKYKNAGTVRGILYETGFKNIRYDFDLNTNKLLLLDTRQRDNPQFYGKAIGKASLSIKGPQENMKMVIVGQVNDTTHIYIPTTNSKESAEADFIVLKQYGTELKTESSTDKTKLSIDLDLTANNKAQIDVILDELTGDIIKATGNGRLRIKVPANGDITMTGRYNIEQGKYDFNFQSLVKKPFLLLPDANNFIEWNGSPYDAKLHIDARYEAKNVNLGDLNSSSGVNLGNAVNSYKGDVYVIAELRDKLSSPGITFKLDFPQGSPIKNDQVFTQFLNKLQSEENEMLKQVTWLIVFGSFSPYGEIGGAGSLEKSGINSISQKLSNEVNKVVSNLLSKITGDKSLQFNLNTSTYSSAQLLGVGNTNSLDRQQFNLKISKSLLKGKLIIEFGGGLDFNVGNTSAIQSNNFQWLPDLSVQIVLSENYEKSTKIKAIIFNKSNLDVTGGAIGRRNRAGVSISYTKDFDKFFGDKPKKIQLPAKEITEQKKP